MSFKYKQLAVLLKVEGAYGVDAAPTEGLNAILLRDVTFTPLEGTRSQRDVLRPELGNTVTPIGGIHARISAGVELAGAGAAGTRAGLWCAAARLRHGRGPSMPVSPSSICRSAAERSRRPSTSFTPVPCTR